MIPSNWKTMRPATSRAIAIMLTAAAMSFAWQRLDPVGWRPVAAILSYFWIMLPAFMLFAIIDAVLMEWFGKRDSHGRTETYINPLEARLDRIENAINRLYDYVQEIDPELEEERRLWHEFMSETGGMFASMNHMEYIRDRKKSGKRTIGSPNIWVDPPSVAEEG